MRHGNAIEGRLGSLDADARRLFACACAQRVLIVVERLLGGIWASAAREAVERAATGLMDTDVAEQLADELSRLPETDLDDSLDYRYYGMLALSVVVDAVRAAGGIALAAASASAGAVTLAGCLGHEPNGVRGNTLLRLEEDAQTTVLDDLEAGRASERMRDVLVRSEYEARAIGMEALLAARSGAT